MTTANTHRRLAAEMRAQARLKLRLHAWWRTEVDRSRIVATPLSGESPPRIWADIMRKASKP